MPMLDDKEYQKIYQIYGDVSRGDFVMVKNENQEILELKQQLIKGMTDFMNYEDEDGTTDFDPGYTQAEIDRCEGIIEEFLASLAHVNGNSEQILALVQSTVLALNELNEDCDGGLFETDQREQLCELIILASKQAGLVTDVYDITEEWREW